MMGTVVSDFTNKIFIKASNTRVHIVGLDASSEEKTLSSEKAIKFYSESD